VILVTVYVDDVMLLLRDVDRINKLKKNFTEEFDVKDLGKVNFCLEIKFT